MNVKDQARAGRLSTTRIDKNIEKINVDRFIMIDEISEVTGVSWRLYQRILTEDLQVPVFGIAVKFFILRLYKQDQKNNRLNLCKDLKQEIENYPNFLSS